MSAVLLHQNITKACRELNGDEVQYVEKCFSVKL